MEGLMRKIYQILGMLLLSLTLLISGCGGNKSTGPSAPTKVETSDKDTILKLFAKGKQITGLSYDFTMTSKEMSMNGKMWLQGNKMKTEMVIQGEKMISIVDGETVYQYMPASNMAMKFSVKSTSGQKSQTPDTPTSFSDNVDKETVKIVETTTYDGKKCIVFISKSGKDQAKMWLSEEYGIPLKVEMSSAGGELTTIEYKNVKVGAISDDTFKLPANVDVQDMSEMMNNMPQVKPPKS
jgi:outer membrane lipoprotein-sorting protein